jgi:ribosome maturation factor RimP
MENAEQISRVRQMTEQLLEGSPEFFLVEVRIKPTANVKVFIDGDQGVNIDRLTGLNRALHRLISTGAIFPSGDFSLEVSSPGLEEPLKLLRQYRKNLGRRVEVQMNDGSMKEGILVQADEHGIEVETPAVKKQASTRAALPFSLIKHTKVIVEFKNQSNGKH